MDGTDLGGYPSRDHARDSVGMSETVLLAVHYQNDNCHPRGRVRLGLAEADPRRDAVIAAARRLFAAARAARVPIVHIRYAWRADYRDVAMNAPVYRQDAGLGAWKDGEWGGDFLEELRPAPGELEITHARMSPFYASRLEQVLALLRPRRLLVAGVSTTFAVESTVRDATDRGYEVLVAADACATGDPAMHEASLEVMRMLATIATADEIAATLSPSPQTSKDPKPVDQ
jgi:nicotinamidase-related amidase